jgi:hypothetical protein
MDGADGRPACTNGLAEPHPCTRAHTIECTGENALMHFGGRTQCTPPPPQADGKRPYASGLRGNLRTRRRTAAEKMQIAPNHFFKCVSPFVYKSKMHSFYVCEGGGGARLDLLARSFGLNAFPYFDGGGGATRTQCPKNRETLF